MTRINTRKAQLQARLDELNARLQGIEKTLDTPGNKDDEDRAAERETDEMLQDLGRAGLQEIEMIKAALERISDQTYGTCVKCGEQIAEERLDLLPYTPFCRNCAA